MVQLRSDYEVPHHDFVKKLDVHAELQDWKDRLVSDLTNAMKKSSPVLKMSQCVLRQSRSGILKQIEGDTPANCR